MKKAQTCVAVDGVLGPPVEEGVEAGASLSTASSNDGSAERSCTHWAVLREMPFLPGAIRPSFK
jgi:hypothetical protein